MSKLVAKYFSIENLKYFFIAVILMRYTWFVAVPEEYVAIKMVVNVAQGFAIVWGLAWLVFCSGELHRDWKKSLFYWMFIIFYAITLGWVNYFSVVTVGGFLSYLVYMFVLRRGETDVKFNYLKNKIINFNQFFIFISFIFSCISIVLYFSGIEIVVTDILALGVIGGRFSGVTGSPNKDAILAAMSIVFVLINLLITKPVKKIHMILYFLNVVIQLLMLSLGFSRGGILFLILFPVTLCGLIAVQEFIQSGVTRRFIKVALLILIIPLGIKLALDFGSSGMRNLENATSRSRNIDQELMGRSPSADVSSGRFALWTFCGKIVEDNLLGVGFPNIDDKCIIANPGQPLSGISAGMHNVFMQALVGAGVLGLVATIGILATILIGLLQIFRSYKLFSHQERTVVLPLIALILVLLVYSLYENGPLFSHNVPSLIFWIYLSFIYSLLNSSKNPKLIENTQL